MPTSFENDSFGIYGHFCCLECTKGHIMETDMYDRSFRMALFAKMATSVYGVKSVKAAPPRVTLARFGGPYDIADFRSNTSTSVRVLQFPFVAHHMIVEECRAELDGSDTAQTCTLTAEAAVDMQDDDDFTEAPACNAYDDYVARHAAREDDDARRVEAEKKQDDDGAHPNLAGKRTTKSRRVVNKRHDSNVESASGTGTLSRYARPCA